MRLQLNLNVHYEGLDLEHINKIFRAMLDLKPCIDKLEFIYSIDNGESIDYEIAKKMNKVHMEYQINELDKYVISLGKDPIFGHEYKKNEIISDDEAQKIIEKYLYLMSEPE